MGTVLYITTVGLYQLFVHEVKFPSWLQIDSTEDLETNLIGVTVVVLAVNFMGAVFVGPQESLLEYGAGIAPAHRRLGPICRPARLVGQTQQRSGPDPGEARI